MPAIRLSLAALALSLATMPAHAQDSAPPSDVDYAGFLALTAQLAEVREDHLLGWDEFSAVAEAGDAIILDTRSAAAFQWGHIEGAVNLPFSDFTQAKLAEVIGSDRDRPILIYCNNNFSDNVAPVPSKKIELALNIPTFINLHGYGYTNVWELADLMSIEDPAVGWVSAFPFEGE
ncbi:rhodanese-like domain-containing protein [Alteraurantiacibacter aquimixticola]|uniref:Rhodanese-like domain-containing protein n=1 Tax=Alteraurantiacibacter aquimixticola TaxID=2489173 RepID=A0A4V4U8Q9_9SPHN|nr:rhodanese-like domain-containing protein [Alteraurantiacibacter aquimixticola]TIX51077.1 rhodanese-like domain-containing protein [Alteraurantiacibacter aquimixticola]